MLFASTSEVYADPEVHPQPESYTGERQYPWPAWLLRRIQALRRTLTVAYEREYDLDVRTARIFNTYGPRMRPDDGRVIPNFLSQAFDGRDLTVYGDGSQIRSFCYVDDLVRGLRALMDTDGLQGEVVNLSNDDEITILDLAEEILDLCDTPSEITHEALSRGRSQSSLS